jgi:hypothetical protein
MAELMVFLIEQERQGLRAVHQTAAFRNIVGENSNSIQQIAVRARDTSRTDLNRLPPELGQMWHSLPDGVNCAR